MIYTRETGPEVTYKGVWQPQKDQTLRVMFNQRMGLPTNESIPFRWKDNTLTADYRELQAGKAYFDKPLVLTTNDGSSREPATDNGLDRNSIGSSHYCATSGTGGPCRGEQFRTE